jgi:conjugative transfer signal peptidase TraF
LKVTALATSASSSSRLRRDGWRPRWLGLGLAGAVTALTLLGAFAARPIFLLNTTPSERPGLYIQTPGPVSVGRLVAFNAPAAAFPYADRRLGYLRHTTLLKAVAAGPGDVVCARTGRLRINGHDRASIAVRDRFGVALPRWSGCRRLGANEFFVFSDRVPNSFDSRYFGPVDRSSIVGVYRPVFENGGWD